jgi:hypothetical protein
MNIPMNSISPVMDSRCQEAIPMPKVLIKDLVVSNLGLTQEILAKMTSLENALHPTPPMNKESDNGPGCTLGDVIDYQYSLLNNILNKLDRIVTELV